MAHGQHMTPFLDPPKTLTYWPFRPAYFDEIAVCGDENIYKPLRHSYAVSRTALRASFTISISIASPASTSVSSVMRSVSFFSGAARASGGM